MPTSAPVVERTARTRALERLEQLLPLVTRYTTVLAEEWNGAVLDEAHAIWTAESSLPRDFASLEIEACIVRFRANGAGDLDVEAFTDAVARLADHARPIGPAFVKRMIRLLTDPTEACPALRW